MAKIKDELKDLTVPELKIVAAEFAVDIDGKTKKEHILDALERDGVTFQMYKTMLAPAGESDPLADLDPTPVESTPLVEPIVNVAEDPDDEPQAYVVKMTRKNHSFEIRGYRFSRDNPFALVSEKDADFLVETGGFRMASPKELKEFYGQV